MISEPASVRAASSSDLARRLTRLAALRLLLLTGFLGFISLVYLRGQTGGFSWTVALGAVTCAYGLAAVYAALLRRGRRLREIGYLQLVTDQLIWTALVYVTGGVTSGGVSLYGLTCLVGAAILGLRGSLVALFAGIAAYVWLAVALAEGILATPPDQRALYATSWEDAAYPMLANVVGLATVTGLASYLAERLRVTGGDLVIARERADRAERLAAVGRLAAGLAHEIRNPLGSIAGSVELIRSSPNLTEEDRMLCEIVQREAARLNDLVGDMLDLAKPRPPQLERVEAASVISDVVLLAHKSGRGGDVCVRYEGPDRLHVVADAAHLRQLVWNLVRNAVQASSAGDEVVVKLCKDSAGGARLRVSDRGPGIPEDALGRIFDAFFTTRSQGTGIGLAVVKRIVDDHGWSIQVTSHEGAGATFTVSIPASSVAAEAPPTSEPAPSGPATEPPASAPA